MIYTTRDTFSGMSKDDKQPDSLDHLVEKFGDEVREGLSSFSKELADMMAGVDRDLYHLKNRDEAPTHEVKAIRKRLEEISLHFYADHPRISELANDLVVLIKRLGI